MKRNVFLIIAALLGLFFGLMLLLNTASFMAMHGMTADGNSSFLARALGSGFIGLAVVYWLARDAANSPAMSGILLGGLVANGLQFVVSLMMANSGMMNSRGWVPVVIHGLLAVGFAYFAFGKKTA
jgi:hypothetical protein